MKIFYSCFFFLFFNFQLFGQDTLVFWQDLQFQKNNFRLEKIHEVNKKVFIFGTAINDSLLQKEITFYQIDQEGKILIKKNITCKNLFEIADVLALNNGNFQIFGTSLNDTILTPYTQIINQEGVSLMQSNEITEKSILTADVKKVDKKSAIYCQSIYSDAGVFNAFLFWVDLKNSEISRKKHLLSPFNEECSQLITQTNGDVLLLCKRFKNADYSDYSSILYKISKKGELVFTKELSKKGNFVEHKIIKDENGNIYHSNSFLSKNPVSCYTVLSKYNSEGEFIKAVKLNEMQVNGLLFLKDKNILAYGFNHKKAGVFSIQKGKTVILNQNLLIGKTFELNEKNRPDSEIPIEIAKTFPSSSEFLDGVQTSNGKLFLVGRIFMNDAKTEMEALNLKRNNRNLLMIRF